MYVRAAAIAMAFAVLPAFAAKVEESTKEQPPPEVSEAVISAISATACCASCPIQGVRGPEPQQRRHRCFSRCPRVQTWTMPPTLPAKSGPRPRARTANCRTSSSSQAVATPEELKEARLKLRDVLTIKGVVYLDLDESLWLHRHRCRQQGSEFQHRELHQGVRHRYALGEHRADPGVPVHCGSHRQVPAHHGRPADPHRRPTRARWV